MPEPSTGVALDGARPLDSSRAESPARVRELAHEFEAMFLALPIETIDRMSLHRQLDAIGASEGATDAGRKG